MQQKSNIYLYSQILYNDSNTVYYTSKEYAITIVNVHSY